METLQEMFWHGIKVIFTIFTCNRRHTPKMNDPTHEMKPERNALKGKVPTKQQYRNWMTPVKKTYVKYASTSFSFLGVL